MSVQFSSNTTGIWDEEGQPTAPKKKKKKKKKKKQTTPSAGNEGHGVIDAKATARVFKLEELAIRIATQLHAISPKSVVKLALTCRALEAPALGVLWENQGSQFPHQACVADGYTVLWFPRPRRRHLFTREPTFLAQPASYVLIDHENPIVVAATAHFTGVE